MERQTESSALVSMLMSTTPMLVAPLKRLANVKSMALNPLSLKLNARINCCKFDKILVFHVSQGFAFNFETFDAFEV